MAVDCAAAGLVADLVELVTESAHVGGRILIASDDLVDRVDHDGIKFQIPDSPDELWHQLIKRYRMTAKVPDEDVLRLSNRQALCLIDL